MDTCLADETVLFNNITWITIRMKDAPFTDVQAAIEERFRDFLRARGLTREPASLRITMTWTLPEGPDAWPLYTTRYALTNEPA